MLLRSVAFSLLACLAAAGAAATPITDDVTDLWWNPTASGRGVNVVQQSDTLFATFFVYGADGRAHWYVAPGLRTAGGPADQELIFDGTLYETTGPAIFGTFDPARVVRRVVGTARFHYFRSQDAELTFTIDGKSDDWMLVRQTWASIDLSGKFNPVRVERGILGCSSTPAHVVNLSEAVINHSGSSFTMTTTHGSPSIFSCTFNGSFSQSGRLGFVTGNFSCSDGTSGPFSMPSIEVSPQGFLARFSASVSGCDVVGNIGGTRDTVSSTPAEVTDLWWNPDESGWGVNLMQQADVLFATFFVYSADGIAHWYVASGMRATDSSFAQFRGVLYETTGPPIFTPFNPEQVVRRQVGTATFDYAGDRGTLTYTVDGVTVTKSVVRQTWAVNDVSGRYEMSVVEQGTTCQPFGGFQNLGETQVARSGSSVTITTGVNNSGGACTYSGTYSQSGRFGSIVGTHSCGSQSGPFTMTQVSVTPHGFLARISETTDACGTMVGNIGGARLDIAFPGG